MREVLSFTPYERSAYERLGNWLTFWYPSNPKTFGMYFLRDFLEMHKAWSQFLKNYHSIPKREGFAEYFDYVIKTKDIRNIIEWAFNWFETKEGQVFWSDMNGKFQDFLDEREEEGFKLGEICHNTKLLGLQHISDEIILKENKPKKGKVKQGIVHTVENAYLTNPIYAMLSGATNIMEAVNAYSNVNSRTRRRFKLEFKVPISSTKIISINKIE